MSDAVLISELVPRLTEIWSRVLRAAPVAPDSNFFDLGGDSLLAVGLFLEIERETGIDLPITTIYDAPTIRELAHLIATETAPKSSPLVLLKPGADGAPFFIVHGIGGTVMELQNVGRQIRIPAPVYALQAKGLDGRESPSTSVHEMAERYLGAIREKQPHGPYWLSGYSFGGLVALEIARRLARDSESVALLLLVDTYGHPATWPLVSRGKVRVRQAVHHIGTAARQPLGDAVAMLAGDVRNAIGQLGARLASPQERRRARLREWLRDHNPDLPLPLIQVREAGSTALSSYAPQYYPGRVTFLKAARPDVEFPDDPQRIWRPLVTELVIHSVPGGHRSLVVEYADALAACITGCIEEVHGAPAPQSVARAGRTRARKLESKPRLETRPA